MVFSMPRFDVSPVSLRAIGLRFGTGERRSSAPLAETSPAKKTNAGKEWCRHVSPLSGLWRKNFLAIAPKWSKVWWEMMIKTQQRSVFMGVYRKSVSHSNAHGLQAPANPPQCLASDLAEMPKSSWRSWSWGEIHRNSTRYPVDVQEDDDDDDDDDVRCGSCSKRRSSCPLQTTTDFWVSDEAERVLNGLGDTCWTKYCCGYRILTRLEVGSLLLWSGCLTRKKGQRANHIDHTFNYRSGMKHANSPPNQASKLTSADPNDCLPFRATAAVDKRAHGWGLKDFAALVAWQFERKSISRKMGKLG